MLQCVMYYNQERLHSAIGYVTPKDKLEGREPVIFAERKRKLAAAWQTNMLERRQRELPVEEGSLMLDMKPFEILTLRLQLDEY